MIEHLYSSPRGPWLVLWCLYDLFMFLELCCDIFPWVPDLDRTRLRAWLVYGWIGGVTSWYQSRLPVGIPLPHSLAEVESSHYKTFTNMVVSLTGPRHHWVVLESFTPSLCSGTLVSHLFGLNDFAKNKTNFRFSKILSPGEPLTSDDCRLHQKISKILSDILSRPCARCFCHSLPPKYPYG